MSNPRGQSNWYKDCEIKRKPIPIWTPFWRGFFEMWKMVIEGMPSVLKFWAWEWEAIGFIAAVLVLVGIVIFSLAGLITVLS